MWKLLFKKNFPPIDGAKQEHVAKRGVKRQGGSRESMSRVVFEVGEDNHSDPAVARRRRRTKGEFTAALGILHKVSSLLLRSH